MRLSLAPPTTAAAAPLNVRACVRVPCSLLLQAAAIRQFIVYWGYSVRAGDDAAIRTLLAHGADPARPCMSGGKNALEIARINNRTGAIQLLSGIGSISIE